MHSASIGSKLRYDETLEGRKCIPVAISLLAGFSLLLSGCHTASTLPEFPAIDVGRFQGEIRKAIEQEAAQARANPSDASRVLRLGMILHAHDQFQAAAQCYSRASAIDPKRFETLYYWGQVLASLGEYGPAAERLRQAVAIRPKSVPARIGLAEVLRQSGDRATSAEICQSVL